MPFWMLGASLSALRFTPTYNQTKCIGIQIEFIIINLTVVPKTKLYERKGSPVRSAVPTAYAFGFNVCRTIPSMKPGGFLGLPKAIVVPAKAIFAAKNKR